MEQLINKNLECTLYIPFLFSFKRFFDPNLPQNSIYGILV